MSAPLSTFPLICLFAVAASIGAAKEWLTDDNGDRKLQIVVDDTPLERTDDGRSRVSYADIIERATPSVVQVWSTTTVQDGQQFFFNDPMFRQFFGDRGHPQIPEHRQRGAGSGVVVSSDGYIVTNNHVVADVDEIMVMLPGAREEHAATVVGRDPKTDLAVLKIEAEGLPAVTLANSDQIRVGDVCFAIGNPFGVGSSVTMGIVSAVARGGVGIVDYENFIQTDASINPGNSGGALIDAQGRLIGINTAIMSRTGGNHGVGFAAPVNMVRNVLTGIIRHGHVVRGFLGVQIKDLNADIAEILGLQSLEGALVEFVHPGSAAESAGVRKGDIIVSFEGKPVENVRKLRLIVADTPPGTEVRIAVMRDGQPLDLGAELRELPGDDELAGSAAPQQSDDLLEGVSLETLTATHRQQLDAPDTLAGVYVAAVQTGSRAYEGGLRAGDVIMEVSKAPVTGLSDLRQALAPRPSKLLMYVWRNGHGSFLVLKTG